MKTERFKPKIVKTLDADGTALRTSTTATRAVMGRPSSPKPAEAQPASQAAMVKCVATMDVAAPVASALAVTPAKAANV